MSKIHLHVLYKERILNSKSKMLKKLGVLFYPVFVKAAESTWLFAIRNRTFLSDKAYIKWKYKKCFGEKIDLDNPVNFNEKNNWRKLYDRNPEYTKMVDKYLFKEVVAKTCGENHTIPLIGVWDTPEQIDFESLPNQFVLKVNHAGGVIVCKDKSNFDVETAISDLKKDLKRDYFKLSREWPYKNVQRKIICEQYMGDNLTDYKNYCFNGKMTYTFVWENTSREDGRKPEVCYCGSYDPNWNKVDIPIGYKSALTDYPKPNEYEEMREIAEKLSANIPFVRVDFYIINHKVYVGEMTFFPWGGFMRFEDENWNRKLGAMEKLSIDLKT